MLRARTFHVTLATFLAVAGVAVAFGCSSERGALENVGTSSENIYGGTVEFELNRVVGLVGLGAGCTGTLLSPQLVLTARHCAFDQAKPGQVIAYLGALSTNPLDWAYNLKATANPQCQDAQPSCNTSPPPTKYKSDIAIIRLNKRFLAIPGVAEPFEVRFDPPKGSGATGWVGENATLVGWGLVSCPGGASSILRRRLDNFKVVAADKGAYDYSHDNVFWGIRESLDGDSGDHAKGPMSGDSGGGWFYAEDSVAGSPLSIFATTQSASGGSESKGWVCDGKATAPWLGGTGNRAWLKQMLNPDNHTRPCDPGSLKAQLRGIDSNGRCPVYIGEIDGYPDLKYPDKDKDGISNTRDNCVDVPNPDQLDSDYDGFGDECDSCPALASPNQKNCNEEAEDAVAKAAGVAPTHRGDECDPDPCPRVEPESGPFQTAFTTDSEISVRDRLPFVPISLPFPPFATTNWPRRDGTMGFRHCRCPLPHDTAAERDACEVFFGCKRGDGVLFDAAHSAANGWWRMSFPAGVFGSNENKLYDAEFGPLVVNTIQGSKVVTQTYPAVRNELPVWRYGDDLWKYGATFISPTHDLPTFNAFKGELAKADGITWGEVKKYQEDPGAPAQPIVDPRWDVTAHYVAHDLGAALLPNLGPIATYCQPPCIFGLPPPGNIGPEPLAPWIVRVQQTALVGLRKTATRDLASILSPSLHASLLAVTSTEDVVWASETPDLLRARLVPLRGVFVDHVTGAPVSIASLGASGLLESQSLAPPAEACCAPGEVLANCADGQRCVVPCNGVVGDSPRQGIGADPSCRMAEGGRTDEDPFTCVTTYEACWAGTLSCGSACFVPCDGSVDCAPDGHFDDETPILCGTCARGGIAASALQASKTTAPSRPLLALSARHGELYRMTFENGAQSLAVTDLDVVPPATRVVPLVGARKDGSPRSLDYSVYEDALYLVDELPSGNDPLRLVRIGRDGGYFEVGRFQQTGPLARIFVRVSPDGLVLLAGSDDTFTGQVVLALLDPGRPSFPVTGPDGATIPDPGVPPRVVGTFKLPAAGRLAVAPGVNEQLVFLAVETTLTGVKKPKKPELVAVDVSRNDFKPVPAPPQGGPGWLP